MAAFLFIAMAWKVNGCGRCGHRRHEYTESRHVMENKNTMPPATFQFFFFFFFSIYLRLPRFMQHIKIIRSGMRGKRKITACLCSDATMHAHFTADTQAYTFAKGVSGRRGKTWVSILLFVGECTTSILWVCVGQSIKPISALFYIKREIHKKRKIPHDWSGIDTDDRLQEGQ